METMEEYKVVRILNEEPEFCEGSFEQIEANYFIICEEGNCLFGDNVFDLQIAGMSVLNWVVRACAKQPKILRGSPSQDALEIIKPYVDASVEYSVILYADTPLLSKNHIFDLLDFVQRKQMNVCKLKRGVIFKNDYILENSEFYSVDEYDFASKDFFQIKDVKAYEEAKCVLVKKVLDYNKRNGVYFENEQCINVDANTEIGKLSKFATNVSVSKGSNIGENCLVNKNTTISGSKIGRSVVIGANCQIEASIIKDNARIGDGVCIKNSVIGENVCVETKSSIFSSSVKQNSILRQCVCVDETRIGENCVIGKYTKIIGLTDKVVVGDACDVGACAELQDCIIGKEQMIDNNTKLIGKVIK